MPSSVRTPPEERHPEARQSPHRNAWLCTRNIVNIRSKKPLFTSGAVDPERKHPMAACECPVRHRGCGHRISGQRDVSPAAAPCPAPACLPHLPCRVSVKEENATAESVAGELQDARARSG